MTPIDELTLELCKKIKELKTLVREKGLHKFSNIEEKQNWI